MFSEFVRNLRGGVADIEYGEALKNLAGQAMATGKKASLSIVIDILPGMENQCVVTDTCATKAPQPNRAATLFFMDAEGDLTRRDPRQTSMGDLIDVGGRG